MTDPLLSRIRSWKTYETVPLKYILFWQNIYQKHLDSYDSNYTYECSTY